MIGLREITVNSEGKTYRIPVEIIRDDDSTYHVDYAGGVKGLFLEATGTSHIGLAYLLSCLQRAAQQSISRSGERVNYSGVECRCNMAVAQRKAERAAQRNGNVRANRR